MKYPMESTRAERLEAHREKMRGKKRHRKLAQVTALTKFIERNGRPRPNAGNSNRIWPLGKVAKPGRMA